MSLSKTGTLSLNSINQLFIYFTGNLALSRALGDFVFKKNDKKRPEEQIVTGKIGNQAALF